MSAPLNPRSPSASSEESPDHEQPATAEDQRLSPGPGRRPYLQIAGGLVVAAAAAGLLLTTTDPASRGGAGLDAARGPQTAARLLEPTWAIGSVIHVGDQTVEVGHPIAAYVRTSEGFVTADDGGGVWSVVEGQVEQVGQTASQDFNLVSDPRSSRAAWLDTGDDATFVVYDQVDGETTTYVASAVSDIDAPPVDGGPAHVYEISGDDLYVRVGDDAVAIDLTSDDPDDARVVNSAVEQIDYMVDAAAGQVIFVTLGEASLEATMGPSWDQPRIRFDVTSFGEPILSPDARRVALREDRGPIYDTETGERVELDTTRYYEAIEWLDDSTLLVFGNTSLMGDGTVQLLACDVTTGSCSVAVPDLGTLDELDGGLVLPDGDE